MTRRSTAVLAMATVMLAPAAAHADGFFLYEASPRAMSEGGAVVALGEEPATVLYNPAGMTRLRGFQAQLNVYTYFATNSYTSPDGKRTSADMGIFPIPAEFVTYQPIDKVTVGAGGYSIYGLSLVWPDRWDGYHLVKKASLRSYQAQPSVAVGPFAGLSFGAGIDIIYGSVELSRGLGLGSGAWAPPPSAGPRWATAPTSGFSTSPSKRCASA
jgi:long-chain fatty acid transport protein